MQKHQKWRNSRENDALGPKYSEVEKTLFFPPVRLISTTRVRSEFLKQKRCRLRGRYPQLTVSATIAQNNELLRGVRNAKRKTLSMYARNASACRPGTVYKRTQDNITGLCWCALPSQITQRKKAWHSGYSLKRPSILENSVEEQMPNKVLPKKNRVLHYKKRAKLFFYAHKNPPFR